jgi:oligopeptidase B
LRGGGDDSDAWAQAGRLEGRTHTRDDFLALVEAAQKAFKISSAKTVIYGRSAGGFLMGMCLNKEPSGKLFGAVYTEVPYVDLLRTTTNPGLPLTKMEYNEFGDPSHRPEDFGFLVDLSPADVAITTSAPNVFVLARTGLNDSEVYAYEPVKWIRRLRKSGDKEEKVIGIAEGEGHFFSPDVALQAKAEDLVILHNRVF